MRGWTGGRPLPPPAPTSPLPPPHLPPPLWSDARFARAKFSSFPLSPFCPPLSLLPPLFSFLPSPLLPPPSPSSPPSRPLISPSFLSCPPPHICQQMELERITRTCTCMHVCIPNTFRFIFAFWGKYRHNHTTKNMQQTLSLVFFVLLI